MSRKIIDCKSFEIFLENFYDGVSFIKVTSLQCLDCNFALKTTHHKLFLKYVLETCLKKNKKRKSFFFRKSLLWTSVSIKLQRGSTKLQILSKKKAHVRPSCVHEYIHR